MDLPGWNSIQATGSWSNFFFWVSIGSLLLLGIAEVASHHYGERRDRLVDIQRAHEKDASNKEIARLHLETAQANQRTAELAQKYGPRIMTDTEQKIFVGALKAAGVTHFRIFRVDDMEAAISADRMHMTLMQDGITTEVGSLGTFIPPRYGMGVYDPAGQAGKFIAAFRQIGPGTELVPNAPAGEGDLSALIIWLKPFPV